jgi:hypothetical protein
MLRHFQHLRQGSSNDWIRRKLVLGVLLSFEIRRIKKPGA